MSTKLQLLKGQFARRFQSVTFNDDGSISCQIQIGSVETITEDGKEIVNNFTSLVSTGYHLAKEEAIVINDPIGPDEVGIDFVTLLEARLEIILRAKGALTI